MARAADHSDPPHRYRGLTVAEWLTALIGGASALTAAGSLAVAWLTYENAKDTRKLEKAISSLTDLAAQTKRQADGTHDQLGAIRDQVGALRDQVGEAKAQTKAISEQTDAIKASSDAAVRASNAAARAAVAQQQMADVTARAHRPEIDIQDLTISGLNGNADAKGEVKIQLFWRFRNTGGSTLTATRVRYGIWVGEALPPKMPEGLIFPGYDTAIPPTITSAFAPANDLTLFVGEPWSTAAKKGANIYFYAVFEYKDGEGAAHARCFGRQFAMKDGGAVFSVPSGGTAYRCDS